MPRSNASNAKSTCYADLYKCNFNREDQLIQGEQTSSLSIDAITTNIYTKKVCDTTLPSYPATSRVYLIARLYHSVYYNHIHHQIKTVRITTYPRCTVVYSDGT